MPCYDPPPPWEGAQRKNAEQAAKLLCADVSERLADGAQVAPALLRWYIEHREIDVLLATQPYYRKLGPQDAADAAKAQADIAHARRLLGA